MLKADVDVEVGQIEGVDMTAKKDIEGDGS